MRFTPRTGPGREKARGALLEILDRAAEHQHRVTFRIWIRDQPNPLTAGGKGGYDPTRARTSINATLGDPFAWLAEQIAGRTDTDPPAGAIDRVDILTRTAR
ncbi:hypothetical protein [Microlunatus sp. Y2014]|uniref:hypothetical protein n=1 Tax=Microlunatus sp. Y2014 TaxID=3418488 RepID=UPI003DA72271